MDIENLERQLAVWNRLLYVVFGSSVTLLLSSLDHLLGVVWFILQISVTSAGFFLLWGKRWKTLPPSKERVMLIFGYLFAGLLLSLVPGFLGADMLYYVIVCGYAIFLLITYRRMQKDISLSDEIFP